MSNLLSDPIPHNEAAALLRGKVPVLRGVFDALLPELRARAFTVTGVECLATLGRVRDIAAELPAGGDWDDLKAGILDEISPWLVDASDPEERAAQERAAVRRAELILRNNGWAAYATTQHREIMEMAEVFPFCEYLSSEDSRVRATHAALNGKIFPTDHPFWETHTPPWEHGCRCDKVPRMAEDIDELRAEEAGRPIEERRVIEGAQLDELERNGRMFVRGKDGKQGFLDMRTPREKTGRGYEFRPGDMALTWDDLEQRYTAAQLGPMRAWADGVEVEPGVSLAQAMGAKGPAGVPAPPPVPVPNAPAPAAGPAPRTIEAVKQDLADLSAKRRAAETEAAAARTEAAQLTLDQLRATAARETQEELAAKRAAAMERMRQSQEAALRITEEARERVSIPAAERGVVGLLAGTRSGRRGVIRTGAAIMRQAKTGAEIVARYTAAALLPAVSVIANTGRAFHRGGTIHISTKTPAPVVAHEITHGMEQQNPGVLAAAVAFLAKRAGGGPLRSLRALTGYKYRADEMAWEDDWVARGGHVYAGKNYGGRATEILTMGIERLHRDPIEFRDNDPEWFEFTVSTLQKL